MRTKALYLTLVLLPLAAGCPPMASPPPGASPLAAVAGKLRPGAYCVIDMRVPPTANWGSYHCYGGTVAQVTPDEIILVDAAEENHIEYDASPRRRGPPVKLQGPIRIPVAGIAAIDVAAPPPPPAQPAPPPAPPSQPAGKAQV